MPEWIESLLHKWGERWPDTLRAAFAQYFTGGVFCFRDGDPAKENFLRMCQELQVEVVQRKRHLLVGKEELSNYPYYYLRVAQDQDLAVDGGDYLDRTGACQGGGNFGRCNTGVVQSGAIELLKERPKTDIVQLFSASRFNIYVVSRRLRDALIAMGATGVEFPTCSGGGGKFFQLRIIGEGIAPPEAPNIKVTSRCPACGAIRFYFADTERFATGALATLDFQSFNAVRGNLETYQTLVAADIISSRVQLLLAGGEFTGWKRYLDGPPIEFGVVEIEGEPWLR